MFNIISYIIYLSITFYITIFVGWKVYKLGFIYLENLIDNNSISQSINNLLLIGYYLVNLGFSAISLQNWNQIDNITTMFSSLAYKIGFILLILGVLHFINLSVIYITRKNKKINFLNTKNYDKLQPNCIFGLLTSSNINDSYSF